MSCVTREVELPLDAGEAWEAVTELEDWLVDDADLSLEPGEEGTLRLPGGEERHAVVEEVEPGERLAFWWWAGEAPATRVELTLVPAVGGTVVRVVESGFAEGPMALGSRAFASAAPLALGRAAAASRPLPLGRAAVASRPLPVGRVAVASRPLSLGRAAVADSAAAAALPRLGSLVAA